MTEILGCGPRGTEYQPDRVIKHLKRESEKAFSWAPLWVVIHG